MVAGAGGLAVAEGVCGLLHAGEVAGPPLGVADVVVVLATAAPAMARVVPSPNSGTNETASPTSMTRPFDQRSIRT